MKNLTFTLGVNNIFNTIGITEIDSGRNGRNGDVISARSIPGRTVSVSAKYSF
jgi:outer membrane receptor protein involved in Fe transport